MKKRVFRKKRLTVNQDKYFTVKVDDIELDKKETKPKKKKSDK